MPDAALGTVVSLELDHVPLEQPLTEAVLVTPLKLPVLKKRNDDDCVLSSPRPSSCQKT